MTEILAIISLINNLLPLILQTVRTVESLFPAGGQGAAKLEMVQGVVQHALNVSTGVQVSAEKILPVLVPIVSGAVHILNASGVFNKTSQPAPTTDAPAVSYAG